MTVMGAVSDQYSGVASGVNNALTRVANVFANAIFGALAVLLFTSFLQQQLGSFELAGPVKHSVLTQAADLGNAHVPASVGASYKVAVAAAYRSGFIHVYQVMLRIAAGLAFTGALMGAVFVRPKRT